MYSVSFNKLRDRCLYCCWCHSVDSIDLSFAMSRYVPNVIEEKKNSKQVNTEFSIVSLICHCCYRPFQLPWIKWLICGAHFLFVSVLLISIDTVYDFNLWESEFKWSVWLQLLQLLNQMNCFFFRCFQSFHPFADFVSACVTWQM